MAVGQLQWRWQRDYGGGDNDGRVGGGSRGGGIGRGGVSGERKVAMVAATKAVGVKVEARWWGRQCWRRMRRRWGREWLARPRRTAAKNE